MKVIRYIWAHKSILVLILLYTFLSLSFIWGNGLYRCADGICGIRVGGWHLHDSMWHLALVKMGFTSFPLVHPEYAGATLSGYNYLLDIVIFGLTKLGLDSFFVFFRLLPALFIPLYTYLLILYGLSRNKSPLYIFCLLFFMFFGSSFTYLITLIYTHSLFYSSMKGFPVVTSIQPGLIFLNLQFAYSLTSFLGILLLLKKKATLGRKLLLGILVFVTTGLKFYGGAVAVFVIALHLLFKLISTKKLLSIVIEGLPSLVMLVLAVMIFYFSPSVNAKSAFSFAPFAIPHLMIEDPLLFYNHNLTLARYFLYEHGVSPRLVLIEFYSVILLLLVNFGTRLFAIPNTISRLVKAKLTQTEIILLVTIMVAFLIPVLFVQDGGWYNTMQFTYYGVFLASFFAADWLYTLLSGKRIWGYILATLIIILTLPNNFEQLRYLTAQQEFVSSDELAALGYLSSQPPGIIYPTDAIKKSAYLSVFSGHPTYFVDVDQLMVTHVDYQSRENVVKSPETINPNLLTADYWYLIKSDSDYKVLSSKLKNNPAFRLSYSNDTVEIYTKTIVE